jgi:transposase
MAQRPVRCHRATRGEREGTAPLTSPWVKRAALSISTQPASAAIFGVSLSCVEKRLRRYRTTGAIAPKPHAGGQRSRVEAAAQVQVRRLVHDQPDATWEELGTRAADMTGIRVSVPIMCRVVRRLG